MRRPEVYHELHAAVGEQRFPERLECPLNFPEFNDLAGEVRRRLRTTKASVPWSRR